MGVGDACVGWEAPGVCREGKKQILVKVSKIVDRRHAAFLSISSDERIIFR